jgi:hypothetical protein
MHDKLHELGSLIFWVPQRLPINDRQLKYQMAQSNQKKGQYACRLMREERLESPLLAELGPLYQHCRVPRWKVLRTSRQAAVDP